MQNRLLGESDTTQGRLRAFVFDLRTLSILYLLVILLNEWLGLRFGLPASTLSHGVLILVLFNHAHLSRSRTEQRLLIGIALAPMSRLISICLPVVTTPLLHGTIVAALLLTSIVVTIFHLRLPIKDLGLSFATLTMPQNRFFLLRSLGIQLLIGLSGIPLGLLGSRILNAAGLTGFFTIPLLPAILFAFVEELLYRGVLLNLGVENFPKTGIFLSSTLFLVMNLASGSLIYALWMGVVGLLFAFAVRRTQSLFGVILAHTLLLMFMFV